MRISFYTGLWCVTCLSITTACGSSSAPTDTTPGAATTTPGVAGTGTQPSAAGTTTGSAGLPAAGRSTASAAGVGTAPAAGTGVSTAGAGTAPAAGTSASAAGTGVSSAGTSASNTGASGSGTTGTVNGKPDAGEYFVSGNWHGYVFAKAEGMGSTVMPMDFKMQTTGMPRCVKGSVGAAADYSGVALLGFGLNEDGGTKMSVTPMKGGVKLDIKLNTTSPLRFQVEGPSGTEDQRWCTNVTGSGFIPWSSLKTKCWGSDGVAYKNEPIVTAMLLVPGGMTDPVPYDFCVNALVEADGDASAAAGSGGMSSGSGGSGGMSGGMTNAGGSNGNNNNNNQGGGSCKGYATGYWDCCKPHCSWTGNVASGSKPLLTCDKSDNPISDADAKSACDGGNAFQCHDLSPWAVNDKLAYGYAAVAASAQKDICGKCYQLSFSGQSHNSEGDPGSTALGGKTMIVQAVNIGSDVAGGQFDLLVPGRGVGMFDACSSQWGVNKADLGEQYGGFLLKCQKMGDRQNHAAIKSCVMQSCMNVFEAHGLSELAAGCKWFVDWFQVADNPALDYKEVACPAELNGKGITRNGAPTNMCLK